MMKHKAKVLTKDEVEKGRSNSYDYIELFFPVYRNWLNVNKVLDEKLGCNFVYNYYKHMNDEK